MTTEQQIKEQIKEWRKAQYRASQMNKASGVFKAQRELEKLYRKLDKLEGR